MELYGGPLDGRRTYVPLDGDGRPPLERGFVGSATFDAPYRLDTRRDDGVLIYVPVRTGGV